MDLLASTTGGTAFADVAEGELLFDIRETCDAWVDDTSREDAAAQAARSRAAMLGLPESAPVVAPYGQLLRTEADRHCPQRPEADGL